MCAVSQRRGARRGGRRAYPLSEQVDSHPKGVFAVTVRARRRPRLPISLLGLAIAGLAIAPGAARAGTYDVVACDAAPGGANNSWTASASPAMTAGTACPTAQARISKSGYLPLSSRWLQCLGMLPR